MDLKIKASRSVISLEPIIEDKENKNNLKDENNSLNSNPLSLLHEENENSTDIVTINGSSVTSPKWKKVDFKSLSPKEQLEGLESLRKHLSLKNDDNSKISSLNLLDKLTRHKENLLNTSKIKKHPEWQKQNAKDLSLEEKIKMLGKLKDHVISMRNHLQQIRMFAPVD